MSYAQRNVRKIKHIPQHTFIHEHCQTLSSLQWKLSSIYDQNRWPHRKRISSKWKWTKKAATWMEMASVIILQEPCWFHTVRGWMLLLSLDMCCICEMNKDFSELNECNNLWWWCTLVKQKTSSEKEFLRLCWEEFQFLEAVQCSAVCDVTEGFSLQH